MEQQQLQSICERLSNIEMLVHAQKNVLNLQEVSIFTGLSKSHIYKLTSSKICGIPCYKPNGKHLYFDKAEIEKWLLQNRRKTNAEIEKAAVTAVVLKKEMRVK